MFKAARRLLTAADKGDFYRQLLINNEKWATQQEAKDPEFFKRLASGQAPPMLYVGCADSRMPLVSMTGSRPGDLLVHRNVANMVVATDTSLLTVLALAVDVIRVKHIVICGHYDCAGVKNALDDKVGPVGNWVADIRGLYLKNRAELDAIPEYQQRVDRLAEMNVVRQVQNLCRTHVLRIALAEGRCPALHGWIVNVGNGRIKELPVPWASWVNEGHLPSDWLKSQLPA